MLPHRCNSDSLVTARIKECVVCAAVRQTSREPTAGHCLYLTHERPQEVQAVHFELEYNFFGTDFM
jgi:hypothetical protein